MIGRTRVEYVYLMDEMDFTLPEYVLLEARGFQVNHWHYRRDRRWPDSHVFVIDLTTPNPTDEQKESLVAEITRQFLSQQRHSAVLVLYVKGYVKAINALPKALNYITSNMRGSLVGAVVDAAQISYALKNKP